MKKFTITLISLGVAAIFHGAQHFWGWRGMAGVFLAVGIFVLVAWALYWRQLRKLRDSTRWMSDEDRMLVYATAHFDAEARRDMERIEGQERRVLGEDHRSP